MLVIGAKDSDSPDGHPPQRSQNHAIHGSYEGRYVSELESTTEFYSSELGGKVTIDRIDLAGAQATSFEYSVNDAVATGFLSDKAVQKVGTERFVTHLEAFHAGYHLEIDIAGYDVSERESIRNHVLDSIRWDGTVVSQAD